MTKAGEQAKDSSSSVSWGEALRNWVGHHWKEGTLIGLFVVYLGWSCKAILKLENQVGDQQDVIETLRKWAGCLEQEEMTGKDYRFIWPTLGCIEVPVRSEASEEALAAPAE